jgi:aminopeptidase
MKDSRLEKLAYVLVNYSVKVKKGDFVFIRADYSAKDWVVAVSKEAIKAGGHVETCIISEEIEEVKLKNATDEQLKEGNYMLETMLKKADVWLTAWGHQNTKFNSKIDSEKIRFSVIGSKKWRSIYSSRMGDGTLRWCGTQFPTHSDAQEASMSLSEYEDFVYGAGLLDKDDPIAEWEKVNKLHKKWVDYLNDKKELHIISKETDIKVGIENRKWISCAGEANFPDGEIFTSPIEDKINGVITFSFPGIFAGKEIEDIKLEIADGKVIKAYAKKGKICWRNF